MDSSFHLHLSPSDFCMLKMRYVTQPPKGMAGHFCVVNTWSWVLSWTLTSFACDGTVWISSGCHNKISQTRWLKQQKGIFSQFWMLGSPRSGCHQFGVWTLILTCRPSPSHCVLTWQMVSTSKLSGASVYKGTNPTMKAPPSWPHLILIASQRPHFQISSHGGVMASTYEFWWDTSQSTGGTMIQRDVK